MENLKEMTSKELKEIAKNLHISGWWKMKKEDLITAISSMTEEEKAEGQKDEENEKKLFDHYQKNWPKYGPKNDWVKFLDKYNSGKIELIEDIFTDEEVEEIEARTICGESFDAATQAAIEETPIELTETEEAPEEPAPSSAPEENKEEKPKKEIKKPSLKLKDLTFNGKTQTIKEWATELNMPWPTLYDRVNRNGWTVEKALTTPLRKRRK